MLGGTQRRESWRVTVVVAFCLGLLGCAMHTRIPFDPDASQSQAFQRGTDPIVDYVHAPLALNSHELSEHDTKYYRVKQLTFPSYGANGQAQDQVKAHYYRSKRPGKKKLVIVLPVWGVSDYPSSTITQGIIARSRGDTNVVEFIGERYLMDWDAMNNAATEAAFRQVMHAQAQRFITTAIDIRRFLDWLENQSEVDTNRIAIIGFSIGAMIAAMTVANEPRLSTAVLVMGGAHPHDVFATCLGRTGDLRSEIMARFDWTQERYREELVPIFTPTDPARFAGRVDPAKILIFDATFDDCIPQHARDDLWEAMGRPERISIHAEHRQAFFAMTPFEGNFIRREIYAFLDRVL
jgi:dienelactone hydrolase